MTNPERKPRLLAKLCLSVGTLLVLAGLGEVVARVAGFGAMPQFLEVRSHEYLQMVPVPNQEKFVGFDDPRTGERPVPMRIPPGASSRAPRGSSSPVR